jgi:hypothetical protein
MKTQLLRLKTRMLWAPAIAAVLFTFSPHGLATDPGPARGEVIDTQLDGTVFMCAESPVGFCASGSVSSGLLKGSKEAVYQGFSLSAGMPGIEDPSTFSYLGTQVFRTAKGDLHMSVIGVQDSRRQVFSEIARITGGTGRFTNATGNLFISGTLTPDGTAFQSRVTGQVYFDHSSR